MTRSDRKLTQSLKSGGTTYALTQHSYSGTRLQVHPRSG